MDSSSTGSSGENREDISPIDATLNIKGSDEAAIVEPGTDGGDSREAEEIGRHTVEGEDGGASLEETTLERGGLVATTSVTVGADTRAPIMGAKAGDGRLATLAGAGPMRAETADEGSMRAGPVAQRPRRCWKRCLCFRAGMDLMRGPCAPYAAQWALVCAAADVSDVSDDTDASIDNDAEDVEIGRHTVEGEDGGASLEETTLERGGLVATTSVTVGADTRAPIMGAKAGDGRLATLAGAGPMRAETADEGSMRAGPVAQRPRRCWKRCLCFRAGMDLMRGPCAPYAAQWALVCAAADVSDVSDDTDASIDNDAEDVEIIDLTNITTSSESSESEEPPASPVY